MPAVRAEKRQHAAAAGFEPVEDVGIETHGDGLLRGPIELADFGGAPVEDRGSVGKINVAVSFCGDGADVGLAVASFGADVGDGGVGCREQAGESEGRGDGSCAGYGGARNPAEGVLWA